MLDAFSNMLRDMTRSVPRVFPRDTAPSFQLFVLKAFSSVLFDLPILLFCKDKHETAMEL